MKKRETFIRNTEITKKDANKVLEVKSAINEFLKNHSLALNGKLEMTALVNLQTD
jgi:hypothetical protein